jgi:hypothetical protein
MIKMIRQNSVGVVRHLRSTLLCTYLMQQMTFLSTSVPDRLVLLKHRLLSSKQPEQPL